MSLLQAVKPLYYRLFDDTLEECDVTLAYVFHTEWVWDDATLAQLRAFAAEYAAITGKRPICCVMSGCNQRVAKSLERRGMSASEYAGRLRGLAEFVDLGYHGHYWLDERAPDTPLNYLLQHNFVRESLAAQFTRDMNWFADNDIRHNGLYTGGWWFFNENLMDLLRAQGFKWDFTFSRYPAFYNPFTWAFMEQTGIRTGEPFSIVSPDGTRFNFLQNLVGCHETDFPQDLVRYLRPNAEPRLHTRPGCDPQPRLLVAQVL